MNICEVRSWDSGFFGLTIAQVRSGQVNASDLATTLAWADQAGVDCIYLLVDADDVTSIRAADSAAFVLVDERLTLERSLDGIPEGVVMSAPGTSKRMAIRPARGPDIPRLTSIARVSHRGTRFHRDRHFDPRRADDLYAEWIGRSVTGSLADAVFVAEADDDVVGYVTTSHRADTSSIGLIAVDEAMRGQGIGRRLLSAALQWAASRGGPRISVVTQGQSAQAVRFYTDAGFARVRSQLWYHWWRDAAQGGEGRGSGRL